tara:strand:- start:174 stop:545 length:372 start_codon:yes stop_codon:yes gene_type:complete
MSVASFNADLSKFAKTVNLDIETVVRKVAFDIYKGVTQKTPVDTGRAKANWNIGYGNANYTITENTTFRAIAPPKGAGKRTIYITNSLPYINALENGSSKQAPSGMVNLTMQDVQRSIRNVIR